MVIFGRFSKLTLSYTLSPIIAMYRNIRVSNTIDHKLLTALHKVYIYGLLQYYRGLKKIFHKV